MTHWRERLPVPRDQFVPPVVWVDDLITGGYVSVSREDDEPAWRKLVDADEPIITQVDDGKTPPGGVGQQISSSCSAPSVVADMLDALDARPGHDVLEIGTGTGWNAALLSRRVGGSGRVVTVEVDAALATAARAALHEAGYEPLVVAADGTEGYPSGAPYDRVIATASVRAIPRAWIEQTRPGGAIVVPWGSDYCNGTLMRLDVRYDGSAVGRCGSHVEFMRVRSARRYYMEPAADEQAAADTTTTTLTVRDMRDMTVYGRGAMIIGLRVPRCYLTVEDPDDDHRRYELHDVGSGSWAAVDLVRGEHPWTVRQLGPRRLWDEVTAAHAWWTSEGRPGPEHLTLTIDTEGGHWLSLDNPGGTRWLLTP
ncbi:methyltransferase domain-containing protein [Streptoalloteichus hindustanus]|uniref:Protein-L-isoaspartate O-methyltransferase n=1 Tax=Streptoalloteichus hindustanus TaxID=2017 RepID=A0A1M4YBL1_STRHI|nr:methyltransferase domain-containing protein [Streptoalloteichus hindustanus]SHF02973.1 protein-L-isoaspartate(D-aspartate) O-methyltransferase [Streptoalloteichus hindustanus]